MKKKYPLRVYAIPYFDSMITYFETGDGFKNIHDYQGDLHKWLQDQWRTSLVFEDSDSVDKSTMYFTFEKESDMTAFVLKFKS